LANWQIEALTNGRIVQHHLLKELNQLMGAISNHKNFHCRALHTLISSIPVLILQNGFKPIQPKP